MTKNLSTIVLLIATQPASFLGLAQTPSTNVPINPNSATTTVSPPVKSEPAVRLMKRTVVSIETDCAEKEAGTDVVKPYSGTGFLFAYQDRRYKDSAFYYLVTNRHVITPGIEDGAPCHAVTRSIRLDRKTADASGTFAQVLPGNPEQQHWITSADPSIDLAVIPVGIDPKVFNFLYIPSSILLTNEQADQENVAEGDPVLFAGLFVQFTGQVRSEPIVRTGRIAMIPGEPVPTTLRKLGNIYLVDAHVFGGNSGSPMFINLGGQRGSVIASGDNFKLLGVVSGYVKESSDFQLQSVASYAGTLDTNSGIATVVPAQQLLDLMETPELLSQRESIFISSLSGKKK